jgi:hypothetical protein
MNDDTPKVSVTSPTGENKPCPRLRPILYRFLKDWPGQPLNPAPNQADTPLKGATLWGFYTQSGSPIGFWQNKISQAVMSEWGDRFSSPLLAS